MTGEDEVEQDELAPEGENPVDDIAAPNDTADPQEIVDRKVPKAIRDKYEVISYRNAAVILAELVNWNTERLSMR